MFVGDDTLDDVVDTWSRARSAMEEARLPLSGAIIAERIRTDVPIVVHASASTDIGSGGSLVPPSGVRSQRG